MGISAFLIRYAPLFPYVECSGVWPMYQMCCTKDTHDIHPGPFLAMIVNYSIMTYYGNLVNDLVVFFGNIAGFMCGAIYFGVFCFYCNSPTYSYYRKILLYILSCLLCCVHLPGMALNSEFHSDIVGLMGCVSSIILMGSPLCTINQVLAEKSTKSMNLVISIAMTANGFAWFLYGIVEEHGNLVLLVPNSIGFMAGCFQLALFCIYPSNKTIAYQLVQNKSVSPEI